MSSSSAGYRLLLSQSGLPRLAAAILVSRLAGAMGSVALVLFVLDRLQSPWLAGLAVTAAWLPGLLFSPIAGALLDRHGHARLAALDFTIGAAGSLALVAADRTGALSAGLLLVLVGLSSLTLPLGLTGARTLLPLLLPRALWDRGNALDAVSFQVAALAGPALAGLAVAAAGVLPALAAVAAGYALAAVLVAGVTEPATREGPRTRLGGEVVNGLRYVAAHPVLRSLLVALSLANCAAGLLEVALPTSIVAIKGESPALVGLLWAVLGAGGLVAGIVAGRVATEGRERPLIVGGMAASAAGYLLAATGGHPAWQALGMAAAGAAAGASDVAIFSLRQRTTPAAWYGRAGALSMSLNALGLPVGSALAGPLLGLSLSAALVAPTFLASAATLVLVVALPRREAGLRCR